MLESGMLPIPEQRRRVILSLEITILYLSGQTQGPSGFPSFLFLTTSCLPPTLAKEESGNAIGLSVKNDSRAPPKKDI